MATTVIFFISLSFDCCFLCFFQYIHVLHFKTDFLFDLRTDWTLNTAPYNFIRASLHGEATNIIK